MIKGLRLWALWLFALFDGVYGTALVYNGVVSGQRMRLIYGLPILLFGIWLTGNILASAKRFYRHQRSTT